MLITPRKTDALDTLSSEIFSTPKRPLRDRSLSLSPSGSSSRRSPASSPEKGVTFSAVSFYKPKSDYLNPFERMVAGKPKIYVPPSIVKPKSKPKVIGKINSVSRSGQKPLPSKNLTSIARPKQVNKSRIPVLQQKEISSALASPVTPTKQNGSQAANSRKSPLKTNGETNPEPLGSDMVNDSEKSTPTKRKSPRKSVSPGKRSSPAKGSPRRRKFFVTRSPARDRKRWMTDAYAKTNFSLDFNKTSKSAKRLSPKSETKKRIKFDKTVTPNGPKKTSTNSSANTPTTSRSRPKQPVTPNGQNVVQNTPEEKLTTPIKRRRIGHRSAADTRTTSSGSAKSSVGFMADKSVENSPEGESSLVNNFENQDATVPIESENGILEGDTSLAENIPSVVQSKSSGSPSKEDSPAKLTPSKCYPIFEVTDKSKGRSRSPIVLRSPQRSSPRTKSNKFLKSNGTDQMIIDAGQRDLGARQCPSCSMVYSVGEVHDEMIHSKYHEEFFSILRFPGWKRERVVGEFTNGRVIKVLPSDPNFMMRKVEEVRALVDRDLGFCVFSLPSNPCAAFFLYVTLDKKIAGCVIAETITSAFRALPSSDPSSSPSRTSKGWFCSTEPSKALCGISRVWTEPTHRRQKVATRLIECLRGNFLYGQVLTMDDIAFSDPTPSGKEFATKYTGTETFLVYK